MVAVHNDYSQGSYNYTFWLFTKGRYCAKGEGRFDVDALKQVRDAAKKLIQDDETW